MLLDTKADKVYINRCPGVKKTVINSVPWISAVSGWTEPSRLMAWRLFANEGRKHRWKKQKTDFSRCEKITRLKSLQTAAK